MKFRKFGKKDLSVSVLGFGCMRLPTLGKPELIDEEAARTMVRYGIDNGINYIDTAYAYHGGESEEFVGRTLQDGYREKIQLATKMPTWLTKQYSDFDKYLDEQMEKLQTGFIDFYLLHTLNDVRWTSLKELNVLKWAEKARDDGKIGQIGFSFHDDFEAFDRILNDYDNWDFCQIQYNYMDIDEQAGKKGLQSAAAKGLAVVIMEPLLGGKLANPPEEVTSILKAESPARTPADWALQWVWDQPEVTLLLSGMTTIEQVQQNLASADRSVIGSMGVENQKIITRARNKYLDLSPIPCTQCQYCMPCPNGVNIPRNFEIFNRGEMYRNWSDANWHYTILDAENRASACIDCNECEEKCPQQIPISDWMPYLDEVLNKNIEYDGRRDPLSK